MRPSDYVQFLSEQLETVAQGEDVEPILLRGQFGCGKTQMHYDGAAKRGLKLREGLEVSDALVRDPTDVGGFPAFKGDTATWLEPDWSKRLSHYAAKHPVVMFFADDLGACTPAVQIAHLRLFLEKESGAVKLPKNCLIVGATNRKEDRTQHNPMSPPLMTRMRTVDLEYSTADFLDYAVRNGFSSAITGFINFAPDWLCVPEDKVEKDVPLNVPRTWAFLSRYLYRIEKYQGRTVQSLLARDHEIFNGIVGKAAGAAFSGYINVYRDLVRIDDLMSGKANFPEAWPDEKQDGKCALAAAISAVFAKDPKNKVVGKRVGELICGIPQDDVLFAAAVLRDCMKVGPANVTENPVVLYPGIIRFAADNSIMLK